METNSFLRSSAVSRPSFMNKRFLPALGWASRTAWLSRLVEPVYGNRSTGWIQGVANTLRRTPKRLTLLNRYVVHVNRETLLVYRVRLSRVHENHAALHIHAPQGTADVQGILPWTTCIDLKV
jgi:hypothetical protein